MDDDTKKSRRRIHGNFDGPIEKMFAAYFCLAAQEINNLEGSFVEMGFGEGKSAKIFIELMNVGLISKRDIWLCDSFKGFPEPTIEDKSPKNLYKGMWSNSASGLVTVESALKLKNLIDTEVHVIEGYFEDTIPSKYTGGPIAILHLDCDLYNSYKVSLEGLYDKVVPGGLILFDEYKSPTQLKNYPGAAKAIDEFFEGVNRRLIRVQFQEDSIQKFHMYKP